MTYLPVILDSPVPIEIIADVGLVRKSQNMGAHHGDFYSVPSFGLQPPLEQSAHSMVIQAFTLGEHPSNANYEKRKVISK